MWLVRDMKLYKNISRFRFRRMFSKGGHAEARLRWGLSLKPGDVISACTGFNVRVAKTTPSKVRAARWWGFGGIKFNGRGHGWFIDDVLVEDTAGGHHYIMSCCWEPETVKQIEEQWAGWAGSSDMTSWAKIAQMVKDGQRICDDAGVILPEVQSILDGDIMQALMGQEP